MSPLLIAGYLVLCFMVALLGNSTRLGFFRSFLYSILLTPFLITLFLLIITTLDSKTGETPRSGRAEKSKS